MLDGVDVSYAQGNYTPGAESFVICNASRANIGLAVGSEYRNQVANARAAGKHVGHYFFNGNIEPTTCADFFVNNLDYRAGDSLWLDVESEASTATYAWSPAQALAFINHVKSRMGVTPGVYLNRSLMDGYDWSAVVAAGAPLWIAYYNSSPPPISWWPTWTVWQYTSNPIDRNKAQVASLSPAGGGATPITDNPLGGIPLPVLIRKPDGSIGYVSDAGLLDPISDPQEVSALVATGLVTDKYVQLPNPQIWDLLTVRTNRVRAASAPTVKPVVNVATPVVNVDIAGIVKGVLAGLPSGQSDAAQITADVIAAIRSLAFKAS